MCSKDLKLQKKFSCVFCSLSVSFCDNCAARQPHEHPMLALIPDFDKYQPLILPTPREETSENTEWNQQCHSCAKIIVLGPMYQSAQFNSTIKICHACEFARFPDKLPQGVADAVFIKAENPDQLG